MESTNQINNDSIWRLEMCDGDCDETVEFDHKPSRSEISETVEEWTNQSDWGIEGASISIRYTLIHNEEEIDRGHVRIEIEPDHEELIRRVGGNPHCDHEWTSKGEGGCRENPGVWSTGGTSMVFCSHCRLCGLHRTEHHTGSQRNPDEHDTVEYSQPENWCMECESEQCHCDAWILRKYEGGIPYYWSETGDMWGVLHNATRYKTESEAEEVASDMDDDEEIDVIQRPDEDDE